MFVSALPETDPLGPLLDSPPPAIGAERVADLLARHWGLSGPLHPLTSERDLNHRLDAPAGRYVVKIANAAEPHAPTRFQNRALPHSAAPNPPLPIPLSLIPISPSLRIQRVRSPWATGRTQQKHIRTVTASCYLQILHPKDLKSQLKNDGVIKSSLGNFGHIIYGSSVVSY